MKHLQKSMFSVISHIVAIALFLPYNIIAQTIDYKGVEKVALNSFSLNSGENLSNIRITDVIPISDNNENEIAYYIFNFEPKGHIVVSNDKTFEPILGYGLV